jgi:UDP-N-acetylmuramoyl-L-alanyl-D-glutamate--2,6-diaminopimelate ligase
MTQMLSRLLMQDAKLPSSGDVKIAGLTADSRTVEPGFLFAALPGTKVDGASYISQALAKGAVAVICQRGTYAGAGPIIRAACWR